VGVEDREFREKVLVKLTAVDTKQCAMHKDLVEVKDTVKEMNGELRECVTKADCQATSGAVIDRLSRDIDDAVGGCPSPDDLVARVIEKTTPSRIYWWALGIMGTALLALIAGFIKALFVITSGG